MANDQHILLLRTVIDKPPPRRVRVQLKAGLVWHACAVSKAAVVYGKDVDVQPGGEAYVGLDAPARCSRRGGAMEV